MDKNIILYRGNDFEKDELEIASEFFTCTNRRPEIKSGDFVIGRYSMLPFYSDQVKDIKYVGASVINDYNKHLYVADLQNYVYDLKELTPQTWNNLMDLPDNCAFVLKGETNSRKSNWLKDMYAADKKSAIEVYNRLSSDSLIGYQQIYIRKYIPLHKYMDGINGMPVTKEFRFFVAYGKILCGDFYWQNYIDDMDHKPNANEVPRDFLQKVIDKIDNQCNFYTIDVAQCENGEWIVIELNDGQQAGLSCNSPYELYKNLASVIPNEKL